MKTITLSVTKSEEELLLIAVRKGWSETLNVSVEEFLLKVIGDHALDFLFVETENQIKSLAYQEAEQKIAETISGAKEAARQSLSTEIK